MAENHHDLDRLYQPAPEEGFDPLDHAAYDARLDLDRGDAAAFLSDADYDELWGDEDMEAEEHYNRLESATLEFHDW